MSRAVLISIHPEHIANILSGTKVFEYRKVMPTQDVSHLVLYCTAPMKRIVAIAEVTDVMVGAPARIWTKTVYGGGISRQFYRDYFAGQRRAGAFALGNVYALPKPLELSKLSSCKFPPQSFCYLNERDQKVVFKKASTSSANPPTMLFIGGIHGAGKTTICEKVFTPLGYRCLTASKLIAAYGRRSDREKRVDNISNNQVALTKQLILEKRKYCRLLLDGHFTLINSQGDIEPIDFEVFKEMSPTLLVLVKENPKIIAERLTKRDGKKWRISFLKSFQKSEELHARKIAEELDIPLRIVDGNLKPSVIAKMVTS